MSLIGDPVGIQIGNKGYLNTLPVKIKGVNVYSPIATMTYGFFVKNGTATAYPIRIVSPSAFQKNTIKIIP